MYDDADGIEVYIRNYGSDDRCDEQCLPLNSTRQSKDEGVCYIEASPNRRFEPVIVLHRTPGFRSCVSVEIQHTVENAPLDSAPESKEYTKSVSSWAKQLKHGTWKFPYGFTFGKAFADDDATLTKNGHSSEVRPRGKILVSIQRGQNFRLKRFPRPKRNEGNKSVNAQNLVEIKIC